MKRIIAPAVFALAVGLAPLAAGAQAANNFGTWDANQDGILSQDEYGAMGDAFGDFDGDGDGFVNEQEFGAFGEQGWGENDQQSAGLFNEWDDDQDRRLSRDEWGDQEEFTAWDRNQSANLEIEEEEGWFD